MKIASSMASWGKKKKKVKIERTKNIPGGFFFFFFVAEASSVCKVQSFIFSTPVTAPQITIYFM